MKRHWGIAWRLLAAAGLAVSLTSAASGEDLTGRWGAGGAIGPTFPIGSDQINHGGDTGLGGGGWVGYGVNKRFSARVATTTTTRPARDPRLWRPLRPERRAAAATSAWRWST